MKVKREEIAEWTSRAREHYLYYEAQTARLTRGIERIKNKNPDIKRAVDFLQQISSKNEILLFYFGGFLRDAYLGFNPRDIDVVAENGWERVEKLVEPVTVRKNRFGGLKLKVHGVDVDLWASRSTQAFKDPLFAFRDCSYFLPKTTVFNAESIVFQVWAPDNLCIGLEHDFFKGCEEQTLEIQNILNSDFLRSYAALTLARTYHLQRKLGWKCGPRLQHYISEQLGSVQPAEIKRVYESHYGEPCNVNNIIKELQTLAA